MAEDHGLDPEQVLGKEVLDAAGSSVGTVLDVGLATRRAVKFLVVRRPDPDPTLVRVHVGEVERVDHETVRLRPR